MIEAMTDVLTILARGGGGGSGGGGGGSGGGSGGGIGVVALIGYAATYYPCQYFKRHMHQHALIIGSAYSAIVAALLLWPVITLHSEVSTFLLGLIILGAVVGWYASFFGVWQRLARQAGKVSLNIKQYQQRDAVWNEAAMTKYARQIFRQFQTDWSNFSFAYMSQYMTPTFAQRNILLLQILQQMHRVNQVTNPRISHALIVNANDEMDNRRDSFTVAFGAGVTDLLIDSKTGRHLFRDTTPFTEYWRFVRNDNVWLLDGITQGTADPSEKVQSLMNFAKQQGMYYSEDMGWLFLPERGILFGQGKFGTSDINNHVAGVYQNTIVQLYTYSDNAKNNTKTYVVAQLQLPKSYEGIIARPDPKLFQGAPTIPRNYKKHEFEWPDFNKRYDVFATDADRLAAFELINPGFMAYLYDTDKNVTIEVVDDVVYLYKNVKNSDASDYQVMLNILLKAHKELKL